MNRSTILYGLFASGAVLSGLNAEIVLNDHFSLEGFVDSSFQYADSDLDGGAHHLAVDQVQMGAHMDWYPLAAQLDLAYLESDGAHSAEGFGLEQVYLTYEFEDRQWLTAGRYASMLGYEAFEPTGLYQYSDWADRFDGTAVRTPNYAHGLKYSRETDASFFGMSLQSAGTEREDSVGDFDSINDGWGAEVAAAYWMEYGLTLFAGAAYNDHEEHGESYVLNTYLSLQTGAWTLATELSYGESDLGGGANSEGLSGLVMANFTYSPVVSFTGRMSYYTSDLDGANDHGVTYAFAHNYAVTEQLVLVSELSYTDEDQESSDLSEATRGKDQTVFAAVELLFTF